jgi:uncharacterized membrane protein
MEHLIQEVLSFFNVKLAVFVIAALPVIELRGAIPVGVSMGLSPVDVAIISFLGSMIPVPFILFTIRPIFNYLKKTRLFKGVVHKLTDRTLSKNGNKIQKYGAWGLLLFVAVPLPGTGVWSGSLLAALLDMRFKLAFPAILVGNFIAAVIIMVLSSGIVRVFS